MDREWRVNGNGEEKGRGERREKREKGEERK